MRHAALLLCPFFLLASCVLSRLKVDDSAGGGAADGGSVSSDAGKPSGAAGKSAGSAGKSSGGANNTGGNENAGAPGEAGNPDPGSAGKTPGGGAGGAPSGGAPSGGAPSGGAPAGGAPNAGAGGTVSMAGAPAGGAAGAPGNPLLDIKKTNGCGKDPVLPGGLVLTPGATLKASILTMGNKPAATCADGACGPWMYSRDYYVTLPAAYDKNKAYDLVFEGPGCGGAGTDVYPLTLQSANANGTVIRIGLTPPPNAIVHSTNPNQGCFDDKEGDDSVDFVLYENLRDSLKTELCYDDNRVFAGGNSSGAYLGNELGCKYAGNTQGYAIRGVLANTGGLPSQPQYEPTCTNKPMAGMWIHETLDSTQPFSGNVFAINRAMVVNGCTASDYSTASFQNFPIAGVADNTCKQILGCPAIYPLVVCAIPGTNHASHDAIANPGFSTFLLMFSNAPFVN